MISYKTFWKYSPAIALIAVAGCSQPLPSDESLQKSLKSEIPIYWEITGFKSESKENLGSNSAPNVLTRFKALLTLKEDTFVEIPDYSYLLGSNSPNIKYIVTVGRKGKTVTLQGEAQSTKSADSWSNNFSFDSDPMSQLGQPRSFISGRTIIKGSAEEEQYKADLVQQKTDTLFLKPYGGTFVSNYSTNFQIRFSRANQQSQDITGQITFTGGVIKSFVGSLSKKELKFTVDKFVQGQDPFGLGTVYTFPLDTLALNSSRLQGTWKHTDNTTGEVYISLN